MARPKVSVGLFLLGSLLLVVASGRSWGDGECPDTAVSKEATCPYESAGKNLTQNCFATVARDCDKFSEVRQQKLGPLKYYYFKGNKTAALPKYIVEYVGDPPVPVIRADTKDCFFKQACIYNKALGSCVLDDGAQGEWVKEVYYEEWPCGMGGS
jgi:hypothetical protein